MAQYIMNLFIDGNDYPTVLKKVQELRGGQNFSVRLAEAVVQAVFLNFVLRACVQDASAWINKAPGKTSLADRFWKANSGGSSMMHG